MIHDTIVCLICADKKLKKSLNLVVFTSKVLFPLFYQLIDLSHFCSIVAHSSVSCVCVSHELWSHGWCACVYVLSTAVRISSSIPAFWRTFTKVSASIETVNLVSAGISILPFQFNPTTLCKERWLLSPLQLRSSRCSQKLFPYVCRTSNGGRWPQWGPAKLKLDPGMTLQMVHPFILHPKQQANTRTRW